MIKIISLLSFSFLVIQNSSAQQDPQVSQYMFNRLYFNPAFAGAANEINSVFMFRNQWVGFSVESKPNQAHSCNIFPNPSSGRFTVENLPVFSGKVNITVYNALGQEVFEKEIFSGNKQISLPVLSDGLYFIKINSGKNTFYDKILIQR